MLGRVCPANVNTDNNLYLLASGKEATVSRLHVHNWHTAEVTVTVWFDADNSGAAGNADYLMKSIVLAPGAIHQLPIGTVIKTANNRFVVQASVANVVTFMLFGEEDDA